MQDNSPPELPAHKGPQVEVPFPTVAIGASAGGIKALQALLDALPPKTGAAYVIIVHLDPTHSSELTDILARRTQMPIVQVNRRMPLEPDKVYVIPPNRRLEISEHDIGTFAFHEPRGMRSPIDDFFRSLADQHGDGYAIVLTGAGSDGSLGVKAIKEAGGIILVQDPTEAEYPSMPRNAIATGMADIVLPIRGIADQLTELLRAKAHLSDQKLFEDDETGLKQILAHLFTRTGHDFSQYKRSTVYRRLARRMQVRRSESMTDYLRVLKSKPEEVQSLFSDLLISVTTFFRDANAFNVLASRVIPQIFTGKGPDEPIRIWVPGCATGEEAYTIAMLLFEEAGRREVAAEIQIFATDLDAFALSAAREGCYPSTIETDVSDDRLRKFFTREGDQYRVRREIRDMVLFATHSLLKDPPFSKLDLISCRNLLIYLERELQHQVIATFSYALKPGGYLLLGSSETAETPAGLFSHVDREARIFQSAAYSGRYRELPRLMLTPHRGGLDTAFAVRSAVPVQSSSASHEQALEAAAPPSMLIAPDYHILNMSNHAGRYIQPSAGQLRNDVTELVRAELRFDLRTGLRRAFETGEESLSPAIPVRFNGTPNRVYLNIKPVKAGQNQVRHALVFFIDGDPLIYSDHDSLTETPDSESDITIRQLKEDMEGMRARLRASHEEYETANEELRAANEELQSINEEHRSTAEELETSKEELQSINEELQTVNVELKVKLEHASRTNNDLQNLLAAIDVGTLFLDNNLCIKRFTPQMANLFNIVPSDEGRPITDFTHRLEYPNFVDDARKVLTDLTLLECEVASKDRRYLCRLRPYRTADNKIEGVLATFVDVTLRFQMEETLRDNEARLRLLLEELSHRVKNTLTVVQSMATETFTAEAESAEALQLFHNRLGALADAHALLVSSDWQGAELAELAKKQIGVYTPRFSEQVTLEGPPVALPADIATPFALVLHELATNAMKYGSLGTKNGTLQVNWSLQPKADGTELTLLWKEANGRPVTAPEKTGFGNFLIQHGLPESKVDQIFHKEGLECKITLTLPKRAMKTENVKSNSWKQNTGR